jgi:cytochrome c-type biogenesis protein CcsB
MITHLESISLLAALAGIILSLLFTVIGFVQRQRAFAASSKNNNGKPAAVPENSRNIFNFTATALVVLTLLFVTLTIISRAVESGHAPFSSMYEFAIAFAWGVIAVGIISRLRYKTAAMQNIGLFVALLLLVFARVEFTRPANLVPELQQSALLSAHVASAVVAYGTLTIGFGAAVLFLIQNRRHSPWLPDAEVLDTIAYHSVIIGFPFLTLLIILGALWANIAWGRYWSWDPKETASLVTWLIYAAYLHARVMRGWRGNKAAVLLIAGFAAIALTFFGNYVFNGLHAYIK